MCNPKRKKKGQLLLAFFLLHIWASASWKMRANTSVKFKHQQICYLFFFHKTLTSYPKIGCVCLLRLFVALNFILAAKYTEVLRIVKTKYGESRR